MKKKVSVIIPVYNTEKYLVQCLNSVLKQTYSHLEILVIDDGSTDQSKKIIQNINDARLKYYYQENSGQAAARNLGLDIATGDFLIMVDSDDYIHEKLIETCLQVAKNKNSDLVLFTSNNINKNGEKQYIPRNSGYKLKDAGSIPWNKFYKSTLWQNLRFPEGYWYEDLGIVPVVVEKAENLVKIDEALYYYRISREDSQSNLVCNDKFLDVIPMLENVEQRLLDEGLYESAKQDVEFLYMEHLVYRTVLRKIVFIKDLKIRKKKLAKVRQIMDTKFPKWRKNNYQPGRGLVAILKKLAVNFYLAGFIKIGDLIWKIPFQKKKQKTGF